MKGFLLTHKGMKDVAALEIEEIIGSKAKAEEKALTFEIKKYEDLFKLCYLSQSAINIGLLVSEFRFKDLFKDFECHIKKIDFSDWLDKKSTFRVKCSKDVQDAPTPELEEKFGEKIINALKEKQNYRQKVDLNNPDTTIFVFLTREKCYMGIDFAGFDLSKRSYNIFASPSSVRATIAYALVRLSGFNKTGLLVDPFSGSGIVPIEAAIFASSLPVNYFNKEKFAFRKLKKFKDTDFDEFLDRIDKRINKNSLDVYCIDSSMKNISFSKKNGKIAGLEKQIKFSRTNLEWLDTKMGKNSVNCIVTKMPSSKTKDVEKLYNEFFYQAEFILRKKGKIAIIGNADLVKKSHSKQRFKITDQREIYSGKEKYDVFVLQN